MDGPDNTRDGFKASRSQIGIRLLYTLFYLLVFELLKTTVQLCTLFQYGHLLIVRGANDPVRNFSNRVIAYAYQVMRFITLNGNERPFPFTDLPPELEPPAARVHFD
ncbi:MAG: hypothetical protein AUK55_12330 [Syntrophobacteraceae bacterium CG2_30_61_12]|nr:MAG: hypothetical protein AUK55_12330 [Syntrophobacteraceae bacterium CG2_30_61_12]PIU31824.1 MAG: DUF4389 domain-containing protein [Syntrophobacteraceae bacterium CG07_land_8_20_14_0_80_61_8]